MCKLKIIDFEQKEKRRREEMGDVKPIESFHEIDDAKLAKQIVDSFSKEPSEEVKRKNNYSLALLRRARRG